MVNAVLKLGKDSKMQFVSTAVTVKCRLQAVQKIAATATECDR